MEIQLYGNTFDLTIANLHAPEIMKIIINDHRKVFAIQEEFGTMFPSLKIEFLLKPSKPGAAPSTKWANHSSKSLLDCRTTHQEGVLEIQPSMTAYELKEHLRDRYGLSAAIVLKSETNFNESAVVEQLSLEDQNRVTQKSL